MRPIDAEPIEKALFRRADKALAKNPYANARVCAFRRALELVLDAPTIAAPPNDAPPNDPMTLEQLREMDGEPVWVVGLNGYPSRCGLVYWYRKNKRNIVYVTINNGVSIDAKIFMAAGGRIYRHKPEETNNGITTLR